MKTPISIRALASVSALGSNPLAVWNNYKKDRHFFENVHWTSEPAFAAFLPNELKQEIEALKASKPAYRNLDDSVLFGIYVSREAVRSAGWTPDDNPGINIGSSRGATGLFEHYHSGFIKSGKAETLSSPSTTLGNISSWIAQDIQSSGPEISHSVTCSTALHAILNGIAWISSGMTSKFIAGGSEAAVTPFTLAQMQAMKISARVDREYPCQALNLEKDQNTMILGEGAAVICMEAGENEQGLALIKGVGYATEKLTHSVSISAKGEAFQKAMKMALGDHSPDEVDVIVMHAPGTIKGDLSEVNAIKAVFQKELPALTTNKWKIGHTFGASGTLSLELAILMLQHQQFIPVPFCAAGKEPERIQKVLVNAVGFGGNAVSLLIALPGKN